MCNDIKSFVLLKYKIPTTNSFNWELFETYPKCIQEKLVWRIAKDVEHLAKGLPKVEECIRVCKLYQEGKTSHSHLIEAWDLNGEISNWQPCPGNTYYSAVCCNAPGAIHWASGKDKEKRNLYISWLVEELCEYELNNAQ